MRIAHVRSTDTLLTRGEYRSVACVEDVVDIIHVVFLLLGLAAMLCWQGERLLLAPCTECGFISSQTKTTANTVLSDSRYQFTPTYKLCTSSQVFEHIQVSCWCLLRTKLRVQTNGEAGLLSLLYKSLCGQINVAPLRHLIWSTKDYCELGYWTAPRCSHVKLNLML